MKFYVGLHQPSDCCRFECACVSINRLRTRIKPLGCAHVLIDSGAFTELHLHGHYRHGVEAYAEALHRLHRGRVVEIDAAVAQDYMCEGHILGRTGLTIADHQRLTIERFDQLRELLDPAIPILPVLQGFDPADYAAHVSAYGDRLAFGQWVGVGSVCKRQGKPRSVLAVLDAIHDVRPDLKLHGFGVKITSLVHPLVREQLATADSMAWSFHARQHGRSANDWREAEAFVATIGQRMASSTTVQLEMRL
jgi:hypothetical protein